MNQPLPPIAPGVVTGEALRTFMSAFVREWLPRFLAEFAIEDLGLTIGEGAPSASLPASILLYVRTDIGKLYVRESGVWTVK